MSFRVLGNVNAPQLKEKWLKYFLVVCHSQQIQTAALSLGITAQSLHQNLQALEKALQTPLFEKKGQRLSLTAEGAVLRTEAEALLSQLEALQTSFQAAPPEPLEQLAIAWSHHWFAALSPILLRQLSQERPRLFPQIQSCPADGLEALILNQEAELGMGFQAPAASELIALHGEPLPYLIVAAPPQAPTHWQALRYVSFSPPLSRWNETRYPREVAFEVNDKFMVLDLCLSAGFAAYLPAYLVAPLIRSQALRIVAEAPESQTVTPFVFWRRDRPLSPIAERTLGLLQQLWIREFAL